MAVWEEGMPLEEGGGREEGRFFGAWRIASRPQRHPRRAAKKCPKNKLNPRGPWAHKQEEIGVGGNGNGIGISNWNELDLWIWRVENCVCGGGWEKGPIPREYILPFGKAKREMA
jgi:hypothetical protein